MHAQPQRPRRRPLVDPAIICCGCILAALVCGSGRAQDTASSFGGEAPVLVVRVGGGPAADALEHLRRAGVQDAGPLTDDAVTWAGGSAEGFAPARLQTLGELDALLSRAQAEAAALDERAALSSLALASRVGAQLLDLPGIAAWQAEIEMRTGLVAAQAGRPRLADAALRRAASLDLERRLMAAEATPQVVELANAIWQQTRSAAEGRIRLSVDVPDAQVFLDDVPVGSAPLTLSARVGRHILRVEAPGCLAYGTFLELMEGERPAVHIVLPPDPAMESARSMQAAAAAGRIADIVPALARLTRATVAAPGTTGTAERRILLVQVGRRDDRALIARCTGSGCEPVVALQGRRPAATTAAAPGGLRLASAATAAWLDESSPPEPPPAASDRWPGWVVWGGAVVATAAAATLTALVSQAQEEPSRELTLVIDPGDAAR